MRFDTDFFGPVTIDVFCFSWPKKRLLFDGLVADNDSFEIEMRY